MELPPSRCCVQVLVRREPVPVLLTSRHASVVRTKGCGDAEIGNVGCTERLDLWRDIKARVLGFQLHYRLQHLVQFIALFLEPQLQMLRLLH